MVSVEGDRYRQLNILRKYIWKEFFTILPEKCRVPFHLWLNARMDSRDIINKGFTFVMQFKRHGPNLNLNGQPRNS